MANRLINPGSRHFNSQGTAPLSGGLMYFYEPGTLNLKDTYSDEAAATPNANPVVLSAGGLEPDIFLDGGYRVILKDSTGVQIWDRDDVNASPTGQFQDWLPSISYPVNWVVVGSDGYFYVSLVANNLNNDPTASPTDWELFAKKIGFDDTNTGYVYVVDTAQDLKINAVSKNTVRALVPISTAVASSAAAVDFTGLDSTYSEYEVHIINAIPATDAVNFYLRTSSDGGATYDAAASDYRYGAVVAQYTAGSVTPTGNLTAAFILLNGPSNVGSDANETGVSLVLRILNPSAVAYSDFNWQGSFVTDAVSALATVQGTGSRNAAAAINAIRFLFSSGNIESGRFTLYGVRTS